ncbi:MAG: bifunctional metallophosphatase/5'-nucleotidase [Bacilli bacterium]
MKKKIKISTPLLLLLLVGCQPDVTTSVTLPPSSPDTTSQRETEHLYDEDGYILLDFYGINDFHGSVVYQDTSSGLELGFSKIGAYLKAQEAINPLGTVITSSGDMWQGSADSNITKGKLVTELMNYAGFDAMALGNHEFDWMDTEIYANKELAQFPFLGANIIERATGELSGLADSYTLMDLGGLKIGIIGVIGRNLESSILTSAVAPYSFEPEASYVIAAREELDELGADVVILLTHDSWVSLDSEDLMILNSGGTPYVDAVFCGHAHAHDRNLVNDVPILQTTGNGHSLMHVRLGYHPTTQDKKVVDYEIVPGSTIDTYEPDPDLEQVYDYYYVNYIKDIKEEKLGSLSRLMEEREVVRKTVEAMYNYGVTIDEDLAVTFHNYGGARAPLPKGTITYGDVYKSLPFDNYTVFVTVLGRDLISQMGGYSAYYPADFTPENNVYYRVMAISYLTENSYWAPIIDDLVHINHPQGEGYYYPRDIVADAFRNKTF